MPKGIREFGDDVEKKIRMVLQSQLTRLDLVNREEFDVQTQVLLRTRESWRCWNNVWANWRPGSTVLRPLLKQRPLLMIKPANNLSHLLRLGRHLAPFLVLYYGSTRLRH